MCWARIFGISRPSCPCTQSGCKICKCLRRYREDFGPDEVGELRTNNPFTSFRYLQVDNEVACISFYADVSWARESAPWDGEQPPWKRMFLHIGGPTAIPEWWPRFLEKANKDLLTEPWRVRDDEFPRRSIPVNTGDEEVSKIALEWLKSCKSDHQDCEDDENSHDPNYYPPRVLDLADVDSKSCRLLVVENGKQIHDSGYVALSHCWGKDPSFLTLTADNMDELRRIIPFGRLPKSFVDSMQICRRLGFRYLWIDSLCIIQPGPGSQEDWQIHAAAMDKVYANCTLNVALAGAENAQQGAFVDRDPDFLKTASVYMSFDMDQYDTTDTSSYDGPDAHPSDIVESNRKNGNIIKKDKTALPNGVVRLVTISSSRYDFRTALWDQPLYKRAWVMQERIMSPRTLQFGKDRIYWECKGMLRDEYLPWGVASSGNTFDCHYKRVFSLPDIVMEPTPKPLVEEQNHDLHYWWRELVCEYNETALTYPHKDKLIAFAAIAKKFGRVLPNQYIAGLFYSDLPVGLLWQQEENLGGLRVCERDGWTCEYGWRETISLDRHRDSTYRAPSWSWASVDGKTDYSAAMWGSGELSHWWSHCGRFHQWQESQKIIASIIDVSVKVVDPRNPYGQVPKQR
ncbi:HET-domain-containing protein [Massarina eburnea CBS 473.64]|uniref:HET-domain-containing protein n=1 Tax=Massarina eburnea CBS 473.64 TaxID=1395130 RepID=A0A6A6S4R4_9PLEO|nr:HET-domain-containing protein [Massarina eburnea CBS 473.64]